MKRLAVGSLVGVGFALGLIIGWQLTGRAQAPRAAGPSHFAVVSTPATPNGDYPPAVWVVDTESGDLKVYQLTQTATSGFTEVWGPLVRMAPYVK